MKNNVLFIAVMDMRRRQVATFSILNVRMFGGLGEGLWRRGGRSGRGEVVWGNRG